MQGVLCTEISQAHFEQVLITRQTRVFSLPTQDRRSDRPRMQGVFFIAAAIACTSMIVITLRMQDVSFAA